MTFEERLLLLDDVCAKLPYGLKVIHRNQVHDLLVVSQFGDIQVDSYEAWFDISTIRPFLRAIEDMTEDEINEFSDLLTQAEDELPETPSKSLAIRATEGFSAFEKIMKWLNARHFDHQGLIQKGIAIKVTEENNPYNVSKEEDEN